MEKLIEKPTQCQKILARLQKAKGHWVSGNVFLRQYLISQFHSRVFQLKEKGYKIESSDKRDRWGFVYYRLK